MAKKTITLCLMLCMLFSVVPVKAHADYEIDKVLATTSTVPVALMDVSNITAATSTAGCDVVNYYWADSYGTMSGWFSTSNCRVVMRIEAWDGFYFTENVSVYLNNEPVDFTRDESGRFIDLTREYAPLVWAPTIIKHPGGETVEAGGWASFVATATYTNGCSWQFVSPEGKYYNGDELKAKFPAVSVEENGEGKMKIYSIPAEMDGWKVVCRFEGPGGSADSNGATIKVKPDPAAATPSPEPTPEPTPEPSTEPESTENAEEKHEHQFSKRYSGDVMKHWQRCECGETTEKEAHKLEWVTVTEASPKEAGLEKGTCSVCGYTQTREVAFAADETEDSFLNFGKFQPQKPLGRILHNTGLCGNTYRKT